MSPVRSGVARTVAACLAVLVSMGGLVACSAGGAGTPVGQPDQNYVSGDGTITEVRIPARRDPVALSGTTLDGAAFDLESLRGKVVVINVWGSWCPPCRKEAPVLKAVSEDLSTDDVVFVGIDTRDSDAAARAFVENAGLAYTNIVDSDGVLLLRFKGDLNPNAIPSTLVLDREGRVAARVVGGVTEGTLRAVIGPVAAEPLSAAHA